MWTAGPLRGRSIPVPGSRQRTRGPKCRNTRVRVSPRTAAGHCPCRQPSQTTITLMAGNTWPRRHVPRKHWNVLAHTDHDSGVHSSWHKRLPVTRSPEREHRQFGVDYTTVTAVIHRVAIVDVCRRQHGHSRAKLHVYADASQVRKPASLPQHFGFTSTTLGYRPRFKPCTTYFVHVARALPVSRSQTVPAKRTVQGRQRGLRRRPVRLEHFAANGDACT